MLDSLSLDDWGGTGPVLHFAHANGFPPGSYRQLIERLTPHFHVYSWRGSCFVPGSEPRSLRRWEELADEMAQLLLDRGFERMIGLGHSMGGVATLFASLKYPRLFRSVVALEPVLMTGARTWVLRAASVLGVRHRLPPASLALRRREVWPTRELASLSYRKKLLFSRFDPACFQDYLDHGLTERPEGGFRLTIPREWEARCFETAPSSPWAQLRGVTVPTFVLRGGDSDTLTRSALSRVARTVPHVHTEELDGTTHLFPLEQPEACAQRILAFLASVEDPSSRRAA
ncbi:alpha/beta hydrolase [Corallococcus sp. M34]|uniref:alpha/beta fold hydrolase n=1 Tax=Citreicoccus inhibens TaxID=2849499 RepID=UPI001C225E8E|nr:alpha/beta hydrolase [Citreicoccus inhibens]MBU8898736.1 alpha/beta hydrolase [Citreicoccus inhibens]